MPRSRHANQLRAASPWLFGVVLLVLLAVLATLQFRWTGELSRAERERARIGLEEGLQRIAQGLDRELTALALALGPEMRPPEGSRRQDFGWLGERIALWRGWTVYPELLRDVYRLRIGPASGSLGGSAEGPPLERFDGPTSSWVASPWPTELEPIRSRLGRPTDFAPDGPGPPRFRLLDGRGPALLLPHLDGMSRRRFFEGRGAGPAPRLEIEVMILWLDRATLFDALITDLALRSLADSDGSLPYHLSILDREEDEILFELGPILGEGTSRGDAEVGLFGFADPESVRDLLERIAATGPGFGWGPGPPGARPNEDSRVDHRRRERRSRRSRPGGLLALSGGQRYWRLQATHPAGSLDRAVDQARRRNLGISFAILSLLAFSALALLRATRRAQRLARTQGELVAGVTHELMTPLAALRSAGQNLADGVVQDEEGVRRYGQLVDREGRRLSEMVTQMLELAGIAAGDRPFERRRVEVGQWIDDALDHYRSELERAEIEVERQVEPELPAIEGDVEALGRALRNLVGNAIKYAAEGRRIGLRARRVGSKVELEVSDRGPGVAAADLPHVFEPFRRGRAMAASALPGSGLGLALTRSIVEAHGGRITVANRREGGCVVTLRLPVAS